MEHKLGRLENFDPRSRNFPVRAILSQTELLNPRSYHWRCKTQLDQGSVSSCVGNAWSHELAARPAEVLGVTESTALDIYRKAQTLDPWASIPHEGTSVLAGIQALQSLFPHAIDDYRWIFSLEDLIITLSYRGPVVLGIPWYQQMFYPDGAGILKISGSIAGGHSLLCTGVNISTRYFQLKNSWGKNWGLEGYCYITFEDMGRLLHENGEGCAAIGRHNFQVL